MMTICSSKVMSQSLTALCDDLLWRVCMIGGTCVLVRLQQTWAGHQGNENPAAIDEIKRIQWLAMMRQLASLRDIILEGGQNRHELPRLLIPRMRQNLLDLNHVLNMFANWETCMTNYEWISAGATFGNHSRPVRLGNSPRSSVMSGRLPLLWV